jgi:retinol dehydrogenase 12
VLLLATRELAQQIRPDPKIIINSVAPGLCHSDLARNLKGQAAKDINERKAKFARTAEEGGRTLVHAVTVGWEGHGRYINDCEFQEYVRTNYLPSDDQA